MYIKKYLVFKLKKQDEFIHKAAEKNQEEAAILREKHMKVLEVKSSFDSEAIEKKGRYVKAKDST